MPRLARLLRAAGGRWDRIGDLLGPEVLIAQAPALSKSPPSNPSPRPLRIAFMTMMGGRARLVGVESVLAQAMISRGHSVFMVLCDQQLPLCEIMPAGAEERWAQLCGKCYAFGKAGLEAGGLDILPVSELLQDSAIASDETWDHHVEAALLKHYRVGRAPDTSEATERRDALTEAAQRSAAVGQALIDLQVDRVVMSHGNYATWGPARDVLNRNAVPVLVYTGATKRDSIRLHWRNDSFWQDIDSEYASRRLTPLTAVESERLDRYLLSRRTHLTDTTQYNFTKPLDPDQLCQLLGLRRSDPIFVLFANLMWDAASSQHARIYSNPIDWTLATVDWFARNPDLQLVVRPHPAEIVFGTNESVADVVAQERRRLPDNVKVLRPDASVNSWSLIHLATCGIVHTSTVGLELALEGTPCVVVSNTHYRGKGFTYDVNTEEEYFTTLRQLAELQGPTDSQELARRYAYILFERYQLPFPQLYSPRPNLPVAYREVAEHPDGEQTLEIICRSIEDLTPPLLPASIP